MSNKKLLIDVLKNLNDPKNKVKKAAGIDTTPQMKKGGSKFSSDLNATNRLFKKNSLFKKNPLNKPNALFKKKNLKRKTYSPTAPGSSSPMFFNNGGIVQIDGYRFKKDANGRWTYESGAPVTDTMLIQKLNNGEGKPVGSPVVQNAPKYEAKVPMSNAERRQKISDLRMSPQISDQQEADKLFEIQREQDIYYPDVSDQLMVPPKNMSDLKAAEWRVNNSLGFPMERARLAAEAAAGPDDDPVDNFRHANAGRYTAEAINSYINIPLTLLGQKYLSPAISFVGSNLSGIGHELSTLFGGMDDRDWTDKLRESGEDIYNNYVGAKVGASDMTPIEKTNYLLYLSDNNKLPDGIVGGKNKKGQTNNMYFKKGPNDPGEYKSSYNDGGYIETELTSEEIEEYRKGGYIVEDISVPSLNQMEEGGGPCPPGYVKLNGECVEYGTAITKTKPNKVEPFITSDPEEYAYRKAAYKDSLDLYKHSSAIKNYDRILKPVSEKKFNEIQDWHKKQPHYAIDRVSLNKDLKNKKVKDFSNYVYNIRDPKSAKIFYNNVGKHFDDNLSKYSKKLKDGTIKTPLSVYKGVPDPDVYEIFDPKTKTRRTYFYGKLSHIDNDQWAPSKSEYYAAPKPNYSDVISTSSLSKEFKNQKLTSKKSKKQKFVSPYWERQLINRYSKPVQEVIFKPEIKQYPESYNPVVDNSQQKPPEGKLMVGQEKVQQLDPKTGTVTTVINPIYEDAMKPIPTLHPTHVDNTLRKFVGYPPELPEEEVIEDTEDTIYDEDLGEPGPGGHWEDNVSRYIDWDGNSIGFNGIRFRKPGHGGDLIKKGRRHYIHYPSIEKKYDAWIEPDEYAMGGEYTVGDEVELTEAEVKRLRSLGYIIEQI